MTSVAGERPARSFDETRVAADAYGEILRRLHGGDLAELRESLHRHLREEGVSFRSGVGSDEFLVDAVPRIFAAEEWAALERGLIQRAQALECFTADAYGDLEIVAAGVVPESVVRSASYYEPGLAGARPRRWITVAGLDVVRGGDGHLRILEDNVRTPSGLAYALAARRAVGERVAVPTGRSLRPLSGVGALIAEAVRAAAPEVEEPMGVLLTDGAENSAFYEHEVLAELAGLTLVEAHELEQRDGYLWRRTGGECVRLDVVYRRTDADRAFNREGALTPLGALLTPPWRAGNLGIANAFGTGVADDKLTHVYVEDMVRFYSGEEPALESVTSYDLSAPESLEHVLDRLDELMAELRPAYHCSTDPSRAFVREAFARPGADTPVDRTLRLDTEVMLVEDPVKRLDNMTMAWGLEARTPFLDHELVELAAACPPEHKLAHGGKGVLKRAARGLIPDAVIDRPKGYFPVPLLSHLSGAAVELVREALHAPAAVRRGLYDPVRVERMLAAPNATRTTLQGNRLWQLALLEIWLQAHDIPA